MKKIIFSLVTVILVCCLTVTCFAFSSYSYTLKDFLGLNGSSIYTYRRSKDGFVYGAEYLWDSNYSLRIFTSGSDSPANSAYGLEVRSSFNGGDISPIVSFNNNDIILFSADRLQYEYSTLLSAPPSRVSIDLIVTFGFRDKNGDLIDVEMLNLDATSTAYDEGTAVAYFDNLGFTYSVPLNYTSLEYMSFEVTGVFPTKAGSDVVLAAADNVTFYVGDRSNAPLYNGADTSSTDRFHDVEQGLVNDTQGGRDETLSILQGGLGAFSTALGIAEGTLAVSSLFSGIINGIGIQPLLFISLSLGMFAFLVGMSSLIISKSNKGNSVKKKGG